MEEVASLAEVDVVMAAIVGIAGLRPALAAARAGKKILLANKESLVTAGAVLMNAVQASGAALLPIDSEHNAIFQALPRDYARRARRGRRAAHPADGIRRTFPSHCRCASSTHVTPEGGVRASELGDGTQDLRRFRDDDEQGAGGDRGALAVQCRARADRGRDPSGKRHPLARRIRRRVGTSRNSAIRTCARRSHTRSGFPNASRRESSSSISRALARCTSKQPDLVPFPVPHAGVRCAGGGGNARRRSSMLPTRSR